MLPRPSSRLGSIASPSTCAFPAASDAVAASERAKTTTWAPRLTTADPGGGWDDDPVRSLERADVVAAVRAAIAELPETQRMALILAKYHEVPYAEIAHVLDSSEKAIKSLIHRARESLRERLAPFLEKELS